MTTRSNIDANKKVKSVNGTTTFVFSIWTMNVKRTWTDVTICGVRGWYKYLTCLEDTLAWLVIYHVYKVSASWGEYIRHRGRHVIDGGSLQQLVCPWRWYMRREAWDGDALAGIMVECGLLYECSHIIIIPICSHRVPRSLPCRIKLWGLILCHSSTRCLRLFESQSTLEMLHYSWPWW